MDGNRNNVIHGDVEIEPGFAYEINLGAPTKISHIDVWARQDGCCPERLTNYRVSVHKDANGSIGQAVWSADRFTDFSDPGSGPGAKDSLIKDLDAQGTFTGRWIRIESLEDPVQNYAMQMNELEVCGTGEIPDPAPRLSVQRNGEEVEITWTSATLESAEQVNGPWATVLNATSPHKAVSGGASRFYRLRR